jgi:DNA-binding NarL/FixJ family response regulator
MLTCGMWQNPSGQQNRFQLSDRELAVLHGIMRGDRDREIAAHLGVSHSVVRECGVVLRKKLRAKTRTEVAIRALQFGFLAHLR